MDLDEMDTLTTMQWLRGGHHEEMIMFLIDELKRQRGRMNALEKSVKDLQIDTSNVRYC